MALFFILAISAVSTISRVEKQYTELLEGPQKRITYISDAVRELSGIRRCILFMGYAAGDKETVECYFEKYKQSSALFVKYMNHYRENVENDAALSELEKIFWKTTSGDIELLFRTGYIEQVNAIYDAAIQEDRPLLEELVSSTVPLGDQLIEKLDSLNAQVRSEEGEMVTKTQYYAQRTKNAVILFSVFIFALALGVSILMSQAIRAPVTAMESAVEELAKGDWTYPVRNGRKDEFGALSNRIGDMVDKISELNKTVAVVDYIDDMICVTDLDYKLIYVNRRLADAFGVSRNDIVGKTCYEYIKKRDDPCPYCLLKRFLTREEPFPSNEYGYVWEDLLGKWVSGSSSLIQWVDGTKVYLSIVKDDTLKKQHEEQQERHEEELRSALMAAEEASRAKSHFLANTSHEIRTPMNSIIGFSELAMGDEIPAKTKDYFGKILESSKSLLQIINDILDLSKIESGKIELEHIPFDLNEVFRLCRAVVKPKAMEKDIALYCYVEPSIGAKLMGDPTRLRQALLNILSNAIKFTNTGMVKLLSSVRSVDKDSAVVYFEVKDSGIGMTPEQIKKIFAPFMQGDISTTRRYGGTGLGLSITKNIIELMGGVLNVESAPGIGSKFSFELTFKTISDSGSIQRQGDSGGVLQKPLFKGEVLICEDNGMNQQVICEHLARVGLQTVVALNGQEGVDIVKRRMENGEKPFDLIFMDIHMPVMDGLEAASKLAGMGCETTVVAMTANIMTNDRETYHTHGMPDCIAKPFTAQELWSMLLKYLTPVKVEAVSENGHAADDEKLRAQLRRDFVKGNRTTFADICSALDAGDIKLAHRLAHTLKGVAGLVGRINLQEAAFALERMLDDGKNEVTEACMKTLEAALDSALEELALPPESTPARMPDTKEFDVVKARALCEKLEPLLKAGNPACLDLIDDIRRIPGTSVMIDQMVDFDFRPALVTLAGVKRELEVQQ